MSYVFTFLAGGVVIGAGIGFLAYNYGKKVAAAIDALKKT